ncbi:MAG TPA: four helix bundle protein [Thermoanaerobaculia bacterium]|nr:four helix bundle protein [Thermoanaerobaculia bacterium]
MRDYRQLPAFQTAQQLFLALYEATLPLTQQAAGGLASRMRDAAVAAAAAIVRGCALPAPQLLEQLAEARRHLRELGAEIDLAERLGDLDLATAVELLEHQTRARLEIAALAASLAAPPALIRPSAAAAAPAS